MSRRTSLTQSSLKSSPHRQNPRFANALIVLTHLLPLLYIPLALTIIPIDQVFSLDNDEGINLMKSFLYSDGYALYREIWSDQPPLFTVLLAQGWQLFGIAPAVAPGDAVVFARLLVLLFAAGLLWCLGQIVRRTVGAVGAIATLLILINSRYFIKLSVSVMIGLPAIALALLSLYCLWHPSRRWRGLTLWTSGIALGLSLQIKLFTIFLLPLFGLSLFLAQSHRANLRPVSLQQRLQRLGPVLIWLGSLGLTYLSVGLLCQSLNASQLLAPHTVSRQGDLFEGSSFFSIVYLVTNTFGLDYLLWTLAAIGLFALGLDQLKINQLKADPLRLGQLRIGQQEMAQQGMAQRGVVQLRSRFNLQLLFPLLWLATALLLLANHRPVWYHHGLLLSIPLAWLGGYAVQRLRASSNLSSSNLYRTLVGSLLVGAIAVETLNFWPERDRYHAQALAEAPQRELVQQLQHHHASTHWVLTHRPIYAFYAGLKVPPPLAVPSMKRFQVGDLDSAELLQILETYQPEQILLPNPEESQFYKAIEAPGPLQAAVQLHYQKSVEGSPDTSLKPASVSWLRKEQIQP